MLGRQAFPKFMATPHYAYNAMKLPGPSGIITVHGDPNIAVNCESARSELADAVIAVEMDHTKELAQYTTDPNDNMILKKPNSDSSAPLTFEPTKDTKHVDLVEGDSSKQAIIGSNLPIP